jgi:hypothetical protein
MNKLAGSQMVEQALHCLDEADTFAAIEFLNQQPKPLAVAAAYNDLVKELYWRRKNVASVVAISRAGIQYCSDQAEMAAASDMEKSYTLRSAAKQLAFNLASYTWPGWNEPDIKLQPLQVETGLDAARQNLRLALELDKGDLPLSRAYWMLGGHLLAARALADAEANFRWAAMYAVRADAPADEMLAHAFASLAYWMLKPQSAGHRLTYEKAWERLAVLEDGEALQLQLDNARSVFMVEK